MTVSTKSNLKNFLNSIDLGVFGQSLDKVGRVCEADIAGHEVRVRIELGVPTRSVEALIRAQLELKLLRETGVESAKIEIETKITSHAVQGSLKPIQGIKNIIAIASGKGGVGKSTVAANIALALVNEGASIGMLDADIYGPSLPHMLNLVGEQPTSEDGKTMLPLQGHGMQVMSIGFLVGTDQAMIWRGPMVTSALNQLMHQTQWGDLDYLIVDMPPGTGDIQLTLSQKVPVSGAVIVTTPQDIATLDARKGLTMFRKVSIPVFGVVENMSTHICSECGHEDAIFGTGGGQKIVDDFDIPLLGQLPLDIRIREHADKGIPIVVADPESAVGVAYRDAALHIAAAQAMQRADYTSKFGNIVVEESK